MRVPDTPIPNSQLVLECYTLIIYLVLPSGEVEFETPKTDSPTCNDNEKYTSNLGCSSVYSQSLTGLIVPRLSSLFRTARIRQLTAVG